MIPKPDIAKWQDIAPWKQFMQVEQDLVISRVLIAIFSDEFLHQNLAFRGGTALHKLYLQPAARYSEDIDLVQIKPGPIKPILKQLDKVIDFFEQPRKTQVRGHGAKVFYRFLSEYEAIPLHLKLEINCKEHFHVMDWVQFPFEVNTAWFSGKAKIRTYHIHELLGTKLRALYQRSKGRDLFDLYYAAQNRELNIPEIIDIFKVYMKKSTGKKLPTQKEFLINMENKKNDTNFTGDMEALLRIEINYNDEAAFKWLKEVLIKEF